MKPYIETNRGLWNGWARLHETSAFYDPDAFRAGQSSLQSIEREALGDVRGLTLLHLQCHFGQDTLSWAREGAVVTGVDLSDEAIRIARALRDELALPATFIASDLYDLPQHLDATFDIVFTSYGVLAWLPDLNKWAALVARYLKPGGTFYIVEFHPAINMLDDAGRLEHTYFPQGAEQYTNQGSYAEPDADFTHDAYEWTHPLGTIISALTTAGLRIQSLREYPFSPYNCFDFVEATAPGRYVHKDHPGFPLLFSLRATR